MKRFGINGMNKKGFSLSENILVLSVLGIIIAITVPNLMHDRTQRNNKSLIRKSVSSYQRILREEYLKATGVRDVDRFNEILTCDKVIRYLDASNIDDNGKCTFTTADDVRWDFSNPSKVIIAFGDEDLNLYNANDEDNLKVFYMTYDIKNKRIRVLSNVSGTNVSKTRNFIMND